MAKDDIIHLVLREKISELIEKLKAEVITCYGQRLVSLVIFGSAARGTMRPDSDLDILICAENLPQGRRSRLKEFQKVEQSLTEFLKELKASRIYTALAPIIKTPNEVEFGSPIFLDMIDNSKIIYDTNSFFENYLRELKQKLEKQGSKKIKFGNTWYWELTPSLKFAREATI